MTVEQARKSFNLAAFDLLEILQKAQKEKPTRHIASAITKLEEAMFWANYENVMPFIKDNEETLCP